MTGEQISQLIALLSNAPSQVLLSLALYILYKDLRALVVAIFNELRTYIMQDRSALAVLIEMQRDSIKVLPPH